MPLDLMTKVQLQDIHDALECLLDLDIATDEERAVLLAMEDRVDRQIKL